MRELSLDEMQNLRGGEITILAILTVMTAAIVAVVVYRLFMSEKGSTVLPGGFKFTWE